MGIKIKLSMMKVLMHMQMRWCMHIEDGDHHDQYDVQINCGCRKASNHDHEHHRPELIEKKSRSRRRSKSRSASAASSSSSSASASNVVKVVKWEGGVKRYTGPIKVGEVTMEFPKHMVCRSDSLYIGQKIPSLSDHSLLQPGHTYFLLPSHLFNSALSFVTVASILSSSSSSNNNNNSMILRNRNRNTITTRKLGLGTAPAASCPQPFLVQKSPSGCSRMRVSDEFIIAHLIYNNHDDDEEEEEEEEEQVVVLDDDSCTHNMKNRKSGLCTTPQLQKAYAQLVPSRPQWKPNLPTITEITSTGKTTTTSRRRRKKKKNKQQQQQQLQLQQLNSSSLPPMPSNNIIMTMAHTSRKIKIFKSRSSKSSSSSSSHSPSN